MGQFDSCWGKLAVFLAAAVAMALLAGLLLKWMWGFVVPEVVPGLVEKGYVAEDISLAAAIGLALLVRILAFGFNSKSD